MSNEGNTISEGQAALEEKVARLESAMTTRGIDSTPRNMMKIGDQAGQHPDAAFDLLKQAGFTKEDLMKQVVASGEITQPRSLFDEGSKGGLIAAALITPFVPVVQWATEGRSSWKAFVKAAPKTAAAAAAVGAAAAVAQTAIANRRDEEDIRTLTSALDKADASWEQRAARQASALKDGRA